MDIHFGTSMKLTLIYGQLDNKCPFELWKLTTFNQTSSYIEYTTRELLALLACFGFDFDPIMQVSKTNTRKHIKGSFGFFSKQVRASNFIWQVFRSRSYKTFMSGEFFSTLESTNQISLMTNFSLTNWLILAKSRILP